MKYLENRGKKNTKKYTKKYKSLLDTYISKYNIVSNDTSINARKQSKYNYKKDILIENYIQGIDNIIRMPELKKRFKEFYTYDYMNYIDMDIDTRRISISNTETKFKNKSFLLEGYLLISIRNNMFYSNMLDKLRIINDTNFKNSNYYFPEHVPDGFPDKQIHKLNNIIEVISQVYTIMKYISIIIAFLIKKKANVKNAFELLKVHFKLYDDNSVILHRCYIKKDWNIHNDPQQNKQNQMILEWIDSILFRVILGNKLPLELNLSSLTIYKLDLENRRYRDRIKDISASHMKRDDFNNKFIITASNFYYSKQSSVDYKYLATLLNRYGLKQDEFYSIGTHPAFIWFSFDEQPVHYYLNAQHYNTLTFSCNYIGELNAINNKKELFYFVKNKYPEEYRKFIADSFILKHNTVYKPGAIYIARPTHEIDIKTKKERRAYSGKGIMYITDEKTLQQAKANLQQYPTILISEYIRNPLLITGKKFHLRVAFLITYYESVLKTYLLEQSLVRTARLPFVLDHFENMDIHDTHMDPDNIDYVFPNEMTSNLLSKSINKDILNSIQIGIRDIMIKVSRILAESKIELFPNIKNGFQLEGIDIMINEDFQPILIECNPNPGFDNNLKKHGKGEDFYKTIFNFINKNAIAPLFTSDAITDEPLFSSTML